MHLYHFKIQDTFTISRETKENMIWHCYLNIHKCLNFSLQGQNSLRQGAAALSTGGVTGFKRKQK